MTTSKSGCVGKKVWMVDGRSPEHQALVKSASVAHLVDETKKAGDQLKNEFERLGQAAHDVQRKLRGQLLDLDTLALDALRITLDRRKRVAVGDTAHVTGVSVSLSSSAAAAALASITTQYGISEPAL